MGVKQAAFFSKLVRTSTHTSSRGNTCNRKSYHVSTCIRKGEIRFLRLHDFINSIHILQEGSEMPVIVAA